MKGGNLQRKIMSLVVASTKIFLLGIHEMYGFAQKKYVSIPHFLSIAHPLPKLLGLETSFHAVSSKIILLLLHTQHTFMEIRD